MSLRHVLNTRINTTIVNKKNTFIINLFGRKLKSFSTRQYLS